MSFTRGLAVVLTLIYGVMTASYFGTGTAKDCYLVAQALPSLLTTVLMSGIYGLVMVAMVEIGPSEGARGQLRLARKTLLQIGFVLLPLTLASALFPRPVISLMAPGFGPELIALSARLLPLTMLTMVGTVAFAVFRALYNARHRFALPGFVNLLVGGTVLLTLLLAVERTGIFALAIGQLIGTGLAVIVLGAAAFLQLKDPAGFVEHASPRPRHRGLWRDLLPLCIGANFGQVNLLVDNAFASYLPAGSITQLGFATVIFSHAEYLSIFALAEVAFARFTAADQRGAEALEAELRLNLRYMILLATPIAFGCLTFGTPLARLLFERGEFGPDSTVAVARILACLAPEIIFMGYFACFWRILFARRRLHMLVWTSLGAMTLNASLNAVFARRFGITGIALSTSCVTAVFAFILGVLVRREGLRIFAQGDRGFGSRVVLSGAVMGGAVFALATWFERVFDVTAEPLRLVEAGVGLVLAAVVYAAVLHVLGIRAVPDAFGRLVRMAIDWRRG